MTSTTAVETVILTVDENRIPAALVWRGARYAVTDVPTRLEDLVLGLTHLPAVAGWRFQATTASGESRVFDVLRSPGGHDWQLVRVYQ